MKPTDPQIRHNCRTCEGAGEITLDEAGHSGKCQCCNRGAVPAVFDARWCSIGFYDSMFSEWGVADDPADMAIMLADCYDDSDRAKLQAWFAANVVRCAELAVDAREELCSRAAAEILVLQYNVQKLRKHTTRERLPEQRLAVIDALLGLAYRDMLADKTLAQTINSQTLAVSLELSNLADAATQIGKVTLAKVAADDAVGIIEALKDVA